MATASLVVALAGLIPALIITLMFKLLDNNTRIRHLSIFGFSGSDAFLFLLTVTGVLGTMLGLVAVICGAKAVWRIKRGRGEWRGLSQGVTGIVIGAVFMVGYGLLSLWLIDWYVQSRWFLEKRAALTLH
jgi:hypothetical protein